MIILGISAWYHDSSACLLINGDIKVAVQEERFTRIKHDSSFPIESIKSCLKESNLSISDVDRIVFYEKPFLKFERIIETYLAFAPKGFFSFLKAIPLWLRNKLYQKNKIISELNKLNLKQKKINWQEKILFSEHHLSHASSAFFPSPFREAAVVTIDAVGEWATTSVSIGKENNLKILYEMHFPHSLGMLYSAFTYFCGFKVNSGEYKLMGLAPYGKPIYAELIKKELIDIKEDGSFSLNMKYFDFCVGFKMTNRKFNELFSGSPRKPEEVITQREKDIAASIQEVTNEIVKNIAIFASKITNQKKLCLAGGVALNCVSNSHLMNEKIFDEIWVQPAAGDAGGSLGAAYYVHYMNKKNKRIIRESKDSMKSSLLGPKYTDKEIEEKLCELKANFKQHSKNEVLELTTESIIKGNAVGWMQGRMEFGPRALGARSIIADARYQNMQKELNLKIKFRESFRPFAPSILLEELTNWYDIEIPSPYMLFVAKLLNEKRFISHEYQNEEEDVLNQIQSHVPAVTHLDYSSRIQTVDQTSNEKFYELIKFFFKKTGCPILVNTSFNIRGEPIVCSTEDAYKCFMGTNLDMLVIENFILYKKNQKKDPILNYKDNYELD